MTPITFLQPSRHTVNGSGEWQETGDWVIGKCWALVGMTAEYSKLVNKAWKFDNSIPEFSVKNNLMWFKDHICFQTMTGSTTDNNLSTIMAKEFKYRSSFFLKQNTNLSTSNMAKFTAIM